MSETKLPAKTEKKSNLPVVAKEDYLAFRASPEQIERAIASMKGRRLNIFDLERASLPGGEGKPEWLISGGPEGEEYREELTGVILGIRDWRTWWKELYGKGTKGPPNCSSDDAIHGRGDRSLNGKDGAGEHDCLTCKWANWESNRKGGRGQDCSERRGLFMLQHESINPMLSILPPTSIKPLDSYRMALEGRMKPLYLYEVTLKIEKDKNTDGVPFSKIVLKRNRILSGGELKRAQQISDSFEATMSSSSAREVDRDMVDN